jgi:hypothetical protein
MSANANSTCDWVDEPYARRLWAQLLRGRFPNRATLLTVRLGARVTEHRGRPGRRYWCARCFAAGPGETLDLLFCGYNACGRRRFEHLLLRITAHAGRRMFQRLRTNSSIDVADTALAALERLVCNEDLPLPWAVEPGAECALALPWGRFPLVADGGVWIAKTFIPAELAP